jgi:hypothetical protein
MANLASIMSDVTRLAHTVADATQAVPGVGTAIGAAATMADIGTKVIDIIDTITQKHPAQDVANAQVAMQEARARLAARVKAHAAATSADLRKSD